MAAEGNVYAHQLMANGTRRNEPAILTSNRVKKNAMPIRTRAVPSRAAVATSPVVSNR